MSRRFQFSLGRLLGGTAILSVAGASASIALRHIPSDIVALVSLVMASASIGAAIGLLLSNLGAVADAVSRAMRGLIALGWRAWARIIERPQFSLRALLVATAMICGAVGFSHLYLTHFASYIVLDTTKVGEPIRVHGQFFQWSAADSTIFSVHVVHHGSGRDWRVSRKGRAERTGVGTYRFALELPPDELRPPLYWALPGKVDLWLTPYEGKTTVSHAVVTP